jgi:hypothetical protein
MGLPWHITGIALLFTTTLPEQLANVTESVNVRAQWRLSIGRGTTILWVFGQIVGVSMDRIVD